MYLGADSGPKCLNEQTEDGFNGHFFRIFEIIFFFALLLLYLISRRC